MAERKLFLTRHLATQYNKSGYLMGTNVDLDIQGDEKSMSEFRDRIRKISLFSGIEGENTLICSSPLKRCIQTSEIVTNTLGLSTNILIMEELIETNMGDFTGKKASDLREEYGKMVDEWMHEPEDFSFPGGESYGNVRRRVEVAMQKIKDKMLVDGYNNVFVCTHVDLVKMFLSSVLKFSFNERRKLLIPNGSISVLSVSTKQEISVDGINIFPNF